MHTSRPPFWVLLVSWFALSAAAPLSAAEKGSFGFTLNVVLGGKGKIFSFTVASATVKAVAPGSPAATAGIAVGDTLVEVDGLAVPGCKGLALKAKLSPPPGTKVPMKWKRPDGGIYSVELVSIPRRR